MKRPKQEIVYVDTVNCALDGYEYCELKDSKYFTEKGTNCSSEKKQCKITPAN